MPTPANSAKPTRRAVVAIEARGPKGVPPRHVRFVVELGFETFTLRPSGCRRGGPAEVTLPYGGVYEAALMARARLAAATKRKTRTKRRK